LKRAFRNDLLKDYHMMQAGLKQRTWVSASESPCCNST